MIVIIILLLSYENVFNYFKHLSTWKNLNQTVK